MDTFFAWLIDRWESLYFGFVVRPYERAVHIRRGKLKRVCGPGWHAKHPFGLDEIHKVNVVSTTANLKTQVVTTADDYTLVVGVVIRWRVREEAVSRLILDLEDYEDVLTDTCYGMVAKVFLETTMDGIDMDELAKKILEQVRRRVGKFGFDVEDLFITDISEARTFRLVQGEG